MSRSAAFEVGASGVYALGGVGVGVHGLEGRACP